MKRTCSIVLACAVALLVGCANNNSKDHKQTAANSKSRPHGATTQPSPGMKDSAWASANGTPLRSVPHPLAGAWQLAVPRRQLREASITATDATHITISAGKSGLSGDYVEQGSYLLILTRDERLRPIAWKINSDDSLTLVRAPDVGAAASKFIGTTLLRAPDPDATTEADMDEMFVE